MSQTALRSKAIISQGLRNSDIEERVIDKALLDELRNGQKYTFSTPE